MKDEQDSSSSAPPDTSDRPAFGSVEPPPKPARPTLAGFALRRSLDTTEDRPVAWRPLCRAVFYCWPGHGLGDVFLRFFEKSALMNSRRLSPEIRNRPFDTVRHCSPQVLRTGGLGGFGGPLGISRHHQSTLRVSRNHTVNRAPARSPGWCGIVAEHFPAAGLDANFSTN